MIGKIENHGIPATIDGVVKDLLIDFEYDYYVEDGKDHAKIKILRIKDFYGNMFESSKVSDLDDLMPELEEVAINSEHEEEEFWDNFNSTDQLLPEDVK